MALIVPETVRYSLNGTYLDRPWVNVIDMQIQTVGIIGSRADAIYDTAGHLINCWGDHLAGSMSEAGQLDSVSWVDLDSATGSTGERLESSKYTLPELGGDDGNPGPGNVSQFVTKATQSGRGGRNGRMYLAGLTENAYEGNLLNPVTFATRQAALDDFLEDLESEPLISDFTRNMCVVHTTGDNPQVGFPTDVTALVLSQRLATQRRRLRN